MSQQTMFMAHSINISSKTGQRFKNSSLQFFLSGLGNSLIEITFFEKDNKEIKLQTIREKIVKDKDLMGCKFSTENFNVVICFDSYEDLDSFMKSIGQFPSKSSTIPNIDLSYLDNAFESDLQTLHPSVDIFNDFEKYLIASSNEWVSRKFYAPVVSICQSSGNGKSKVMYEFSKKHPSVYICLRNDSATTNGFPKASNIKCQFTSSMDYFNDAERFLYRLIVVSLEIIEKMVDNGNTDMLHIAKEFSKYQPWTSGSVKNKEFNQRVENLSLGELNNELMFKKLDEKIENIKKSIRNFALYFLIDEARSLLEPSGQHDIIEGKLIDENKTSDQKSLFETNDFLSKFKVLRRSANKILRITTDEKCLPVLFVLADTTIKVSDFASNFITLSGSERLAKFQLFRPYYKILFIDCFSKSYFENLMTKGLIYDEFIERDIVELFKLGRPLWGSLINQRKLAEAVALAENKLINASDWNNTAPNVQFASLALLAVRTSLSLEYDTAYGSELVARYMATLFHLSDDMTRMAYTYVSEPILAEASARITNIKPGALNVSLTNLNRYAQTVMNIYGAGGLGEIIAEIILLLAFDRAENESGVYVTKTITVRKFLSILFGENTILKPKPSDDFMEGLVSFTHFIRKLDLLSPKHTIVDFLGRCAAGHFNEHHKGIDLFIPVLLKTNKITYIFIEVKNWENEIPNGTATKIIPNNFYFQSGKVEEYLAIAMCLNCKRKDNLIKVELNNDKYCCIMAHSLSVYPFLSQDVRFHMQDLLNSGRCLFRNLDSIVENAYDPKSIYHISKGRLDSDMLIDLMK